MRSRSGRGRANLSELARVNSYMVSSIIARVKSCFLGTAFPEGEQPKPRALIQLRGEATSWGNVDRLSVRSPRVPLRSSRRSSTRTARIPVPVISVGETLWSLKTAAR